MIYYEFKKRQRVLNGISLSIGKTTERTKIIFCVLFFAGHIMEHNKLCSLRGSNMGKFLVACVPFVWIVQTMFPYLNWPMATEFGKYILKIQLNWRLWDIIHVTVMYFMNFGIVTLEDWITLFLPTFLIQFCLDILQDWSMVLSDSSKSTMTNYLYFQILFWMKLKEI